MSSPDLLEIINGPEDGTEFPINRAPVIVGADLGCAVNVRLDETVQRFHARLTSVGDGYRVRKIRGGNLTVNGKQAGVIRSRIIREGGILCVGRTELYLRCAPDGLAKRSRGLPTENDLVWLLRVASRKGWRGLVWLFDLSGRRSRFWRFMIVVFAAATVAGYFRPSLLAELRYYGFQLWGQLMQFVMDQIGRFL
jgi:hypothetical protein